MCQHGQHGTETLLSWLGIDRLAWIEISNLSFWYFSKLKDTISPSFYLVFSLSTQYICLSYLILLLESLFYLLYNHFTSSSYFTFVISQTIYNSSLRNRESESSRDIFWLGFWVVNICVGCSTWYYVDFLLFYSIGIFKTPAWESSFNPESQLEYAWNELLDTTLVITTRRSDH